MREIVLPRTLFERVASSAVDDANPAKSGAGILGWGGPAKLTAPSPCKPSSPLPACCICLEDIEEARGGSRSGPMRCSQCTMQAHPACLSKWFAAEVGKAQPAGSTGVLSKSTASCPSCRCELDWDALALQARRPSGRTVIRMPTTQGARRASKERFSHPTPPPPGAPRNAGSPRTSPFFSPMRSVLFTPAAARGEQAGGSGSDGSDGSDGENTFGRDGSGGHTAATAAGALTPEEASFAVAAAAIRGEDSPPLARMRLAPTRRSGLVHAGGSQSAREYHGSGGAGAGARHGGVPGASAVFRALAGGLAGGYAGGLIMRSARGLSGPRGREASATAVPHEFNDMAF